MSKKKTKAKAEPTVKPAYEGYRYVPAGVCKDHYTAMAIYVKYGKSSEPSKLRIKRKTEKYIWIVCPDRELVFGYVNHMIDSFNPDQFDECIHFDLFDHKVAEVFGINYVMPNFVHDTNIRKSPMSRKKGNPFPVGHPERLSILSDSGGYQYASGVIDYISPKDLGLWYKDNVDSGMVLDIPIKKPIGLDWVKKLANLQNRNTNILKQYCGDNVELVNIAQGKTLAERQLYRSIVEEAHPDLKRFAMGGAVDNKTRPMLYTNYILETVFTGKKYSQYHVLGSTSSIVFPILIALSDYGDNPPHITSDSTTHKQSGLNRKIYFQRDPGVLRTKDLGLVAGPTNVNWHLKCDCPVCSMVKYRDILGVLPGQFVLSLMSIHNIYETSNYVNFMKTALHELPKNEYMDLVKATHATSSSTSSKELIQALDFTFRAIEDGLPAARKRYKKQIEMAERRYVQDSGTQAKATLFDNSSGGDSESMSKYMDRVNKLYTESIANVKLLEKGKDIPNS